jgi:hypothetical protein
MSAKEDGALVWLSEFSKLKLDKGGKTADLQRSKTLDISYRDRKPQNVENIVFKSLSCNLSTGWI